MRHRYDTRGIVLARSPLGEANALLTILTPELGIVRARAQGLRRPGAKLASALTTFSESDLILLRGKEGWRVAGAVLHEHWFSRITDRMARGRAARISGLLLRLVAGEAADTALYPIVRRFLSLLSDSSFRQEEVEILAALYVLAALGLDTEELPISGAEFSEEALAVVSARRSDFIVRINLGIQASEL